MEIQPDQRQRWIRGYSIQGRKSSQEDAFYCSPYTENGQIMLVADGVGGHAHGEFASQSCVEVFKESFEGDTSLCILDEKQFLKEQAMRVAEVVYEKGQSDPEYRNCGTTLSGVLINVNHYFIINIGDSRVYFFNPESGLKPMTRDHSLIRRMIDSGSISEEEARTHPQRNIMYSAIGMSPEEIEMDISGPFELIKGDWLFAFSDGVHDAMSEAMITSLISTHWMDEELCKIIVEEAYRQGGTDNITACCYKH